MSNQAEEAAYQLKRQAKIDGLQMAHNSVLALAMSYKLACAKLPKSDDTKIILRRLELTAKESAAYSAAKSIEDLIALVCNE